MTTYILAALLVVSVGLALYENIALEAAQIERDGWKKSYHQQAEELCRFEDDVDDAMTNARNLHYRVLDSRDEVTVFRPTSLPCLVVAKRFPFNPDDPDDHDFALREAQELCDKLNEQ